MSGLWNRLSGLSFPFEFNSPLGMAAWFALAGVPVGIIALYFLKLRRRPVRVPSTILWRRSLEDLHVNSLFQRLRRNLLLFLQLLAVALAMLALAGPRMKGTGSQGPAVRALDRQLGEHGRDRRRAQPAGQGQGRRPRRSSSEMDADDLAMVITFADSAQVVSNYTGDRRTLSQRIDSIEPSQSRTSLREGLQVAAGLANPSKQIGEGVVASSVVTPKLFIYTDGGFADVEGFSLGNLEPEVVVIGPPPPPYSPPAETAAPPDAKARARNPSDNVAILALQTRRDEDKPDIYQLFGRVHNYPRRRGRHRGPALPPRGRQPRRRRARWSTRSRLTLAAAERPVVQVRPARHRADALRGAADGQGRLELDNRAYTVVGTTRKAQVLAITDGQPIPDRHAQDPVGDRHGRHHDRDARRKPRTKRSSAT